jgi:hypothetical protein
MRRMCYKISAQICENDGPDIAPWPVHHLRDRATCNLSAQTVLAYNDRAFAPILVFPNVVHQRYLPNYNFEPSRVAGFGRESDSYDSSNPNRESIPLTPLAHVQYSTAT